MDFLAYLLGKPCGGCWLGDGRVVEGVVGVGILVKVGQLGLAA